jgi:hypothetical protein
MHEFSLFIAMTMSAVLWWAGLEKLRSLRSTSGMLKALGIPERYAGFSAALVVIAEIAIATVLLFAPEEILSQVGVVVLSSAFATAGGLAITRKKYIRCSCFGSGGGYLGKTQIAALIPWFAGVYILSLGATKATPFEAGIMRLVSVTLAIAAIRCVALAQAWKNARGDRLAAVEMFR